VQPVREDVVPLGVDVHAEVVPLVRAEADVGDARARAQLVAEVQRELPQRRVDAHALHVGHHVVRERIGVAEQAARVFRSALRAVAELPGRHRVDALDDRDAALPPDEEAHAADQDRDGQQDAERGDEHGRDVAAPDRDRLLERRPELVLGLPLLAVRHGA
jgi:hypothetical protein